MYFPFTKSLRWGGGGGPGPPTHSDFPRTHPDPDPDPLCHTLERWPTKNGKRRVFLTIYNKTHFQQMELVIQSVVPTKTAS